MNGNGKSGVLVYGPDNRPINKPLTRGYKSKGSAYGGFGTYAYGGYLDGGPLDNLPRFTRRIVELMMSEPLLEFGLNMSKAPLANACQLVNPMDDPVNPQSGYRGFRVVCDDPKQKQHIEDTLCRLWMYGSSQIMRAYEYGQTGVEVEYDIVDGFVEVAGVKSFDPSDVKPLSRDGVLCGCRVYSVPGVEGGRVDLIDGRGLWVVHDRRNGEFYGRSRYYRAYPPFWEKWSRRGAIDSRRLKMLNYAFSGRGIRYPMKEYGPEYGYDTTVHAGEIADQMLAFLSNGGAWKLPREFDDEGRDLWDISDPQTFGGAADILDYPKDLDTEQLRGIGLPDNLIQATLQPATGTMGGRAVTFEAFLIMSQVTWTEILQAIDSLVIRNWLRWNNYRAPYMIQPTELMPENPLQNPMDQMPGQMPPPGGGPMQGMPEGPGGPMDTELGGMPQQMSMDGYIERAVGRGVLSSNAIVEGQRAAQEAIDNWNSSKYPTRMAVAHAPAGGVTIGGHPYKGGEFIPDVSQAEVDKAHAEQHGEDPGKPTELKQDPMKLEVQPVKIGGSLEEVQWSDDGSIVEGSIGDFQVTSPDRIVDKLTKQTTKDLEESLSDPEITHAMKLAGIKTIQIVKSNQSAKGAPKNWTAAYVRGSLKIHPRTSQAISKSTIQERKEGGMRRVIAHESGHGLWDWLPDSIKSSFTEAIKDETDATDYVSRVVSVKANPNAFEHTGSRLVTESFAELFALRYYNREKYDDLPESIRDVFDEAVAHRQKWVDRDFKLPSRMSVAHAPKGGVTIGGKDFAGGEFVPDHTQAEVDKAAEKRHVNSGTKKRQQKMLKSAFSERVTIADLTRAAYDEQDPQDAIATFLDLDTVKMDDIEVLRDEIKSRTQEFLKRKGWTGTVRVYRGGKSDPTSREFTSVTTQKDIAKFFADRTGGIVREFDLDLSDVVGASGIQEGRGAFQESEFIVPGNLLSKPADRTSDPGGQAREESRIVQGQTIKFAHAPSGDCIDESTTMTVGGTPSDILLNIDEHSPKLIKIAQDMVKKSAIPPEAIEDIVFTGSMAGYNYTPASDIDVHIVVDSSLVEASKSILEDYLMTESGNWNAKHAIMIDGHEVEVFLEPDYKPALGPRYSLMDSEWLVEPGQTPEVDEQCVEMKVAKLRNTIELALKDGDSERLQQLVERVRNFRRHGIAEGGEWSPENLAFKKLRNEGVIARLKAAALNAYDKSFQM